MINIQFREQTINFYIGRLSMPNMLNMNMAKQTLWRQTSEKEGQKEGGNEKQRMGGHIDPAGHEKLHKFSSVSRL